jgi:hypothetical protein
MSLKPLKLSGIVYNYQVYENCRGTVTLWKICSVTCEKYKVTVKQSDLEKRQDRGSTVQSIWPDMNSDDREFIISSLTPAEWDSLYGDAYGKYVANLNK